MNFDLIEAELNIRLPSFYKSALENYPFKRVDDLDFVEDNLVRETDWLIEHNSRLRSQAFFGQQWPHDYFAVGHDGFDNYMFLNLKHNDQAIYFADQDEAVCLTNLSYLLYSSSMDEYISMSIEDQKAIISAD